MGSEGFTDSELFENLASNRIRKAEAIAYRDYDAELAALEGTPTTPDADRWYSPLVKMIAEQENISQEELDSIPGTGANGRVIKEDLMSFVSKRNEKPAGKVELTNALRDILKENPELAAIGTAEQYAEYLSSIFPESVLKNIFYRGTPDPNMIEAEDLDPEKGTGARNLGKGLYWTPNKKKASNYIGKGGRILAAILNTKNFHVTDINSITQRGYITPGDLTVSEVTNGADTLISYKGLDKENHVAFKTDGTGITHISEYVGPVDENGLPAYQEENAATPEFDQLAVNSNEQVHILGSKKDIQGFKDFASKGKPGTQTQMEFEELALNVGDRVKVNTPKDGEGVIKEDRGDKVLLEDGRQVMKKSLTKLEPSTRQPVVSEVTERFQGKVIAVNFSSKTPLVRDIEGVVYGTDIYADTLPTAFSPEMLDILSKASISGERELSNNLIRAAKILEKPELTADDVKTINSVLGLGIYVRNKFMADKAFPFEDRPKHQQQLLNMLAELKQTIDNQVVAKAKEIATAGATVVFDNNSLINHPGIDQVLISKSSDDYLGKGKESKQNFDNLITEVSYQDITGQDLNDYLRGETSPEYYLDPKVANVRETVSKGDRLAVQDLISSMDALSKLGVLEKVLKEQNLTIDEARQMVKDAKARLKGTLAYKELTYRMTPGKPIEQKIIQYQTDAGIQTGVLMAHSPETGVQVAPYTGKESMSDLQDKSKWVTFTVGEIPYKLFDIKTTPTVTATPDITQQSDDLVKDGEANTTGVADFKNDISNDDFKDQSADDAADDLFDDLNNCIKPE
jgi:hypothetical protein